MKLPPLCVLTLCCLQGVAQQKDSNQFIEFAPVFTNRVRDMPYGYQLKNERRIDVGDYAFVTERDFLEQSFYEVGLITKWYTPAQNDWLVSLVAGWALSEYRGSLMYEAFKPDPYGFRRTYIDTEKITGHWMSLMVGFSKIYYLDAQKKLAFLPECLGGFDIEGYDGQVDLGVLEVMDLNRIRSVNKVRIGGQFDMKLNYRINKYCGVGLTLEHLFQFYYTHSIEVADRLSADKKGYELTIGKLELPRLALVCYLHEKKCSLK